MNSEHPISLVIIDDSPGSLELLSSALGQPGVRILTSEDPEAGLELVYENRPQIVLTDLVMPKMTGLDVLDRIVEFDSSIDVIVMTAHYSTESAVDAIKRGACDYLNKPLSISALRTRVSRADRCGPTAATNFYDRSRTAGELQIRRNDRK